MNNIKEKIIPIELKKDVYTNLYMAASDALEGHPDMVCLLKYAINEEGKYKVTCSCLIPQFPHIFLSNFINSYKGEEEYKIFALIKEVESVKARSEVAKAAVSRIMDITYEAKKRANIYDDLVNMIG